MKALLFGFILSVTLLMVSTVWADEYNAHLDGHFGFGVPSFSGDQSTPGRMVSLSLSHQPFNGYRPFFYRLELGGWSTENFDSGSRSFFADAGFGLRFDWNYFYIMGGPGMAWISHTNDFASTPYEFTMTAEIGLKVQDRYSLGVFYKHFSNGDTKPPNKGLDYMGLSIGFWNW